MDSIRIFAFGLQYAINPQPAWVAISLTSDELESTQSNKIKLATIARFDNRRETLSFIRALKISLAVEVN